MEKTHLRCLGHPDGWKAKEIVRKQSRQDSNEYLEHTKRQSSSKEWVQNPYQSSLHHFHAIRSASGAAWSFSYGWSHLHVVHRGSTNESVVIESWRCKHGGNAATKVLIAAVWSNLRHRYTVRVYRYVRKPQSKFEKRALQYYTLKFDNLRQCDVSM